MKFGKELEKRSVLKWKHNNIHYNDLKYKIKLATSVGQYDNGENIDESNYQPTSRLSSTTTISTVNSKHRSCLKDLYKTFAQEIQFISLFVNTENMKMSQDLVNLSVRIDQLLSTFYTPSASKTQAGSEQSGTYNSMRQRKFIRCCNEANLLLDRYNELSQFINLQKLLLRKLFKKFLKYSSLSNKTEFIQHIKDQFLEGNPESFVNLNLNDAIKELSIIVDVLNSINENKKFNFPSNSNIDNSFTKSAKFDVLSMTKGVFHKRFLVHNDNINELKIKLLKEFDFISDEDANTTTTTATPSLLKHTNSHLNLQKTLNPHLSKTHVEEPELSLDHTVHSLVLNSPLAIDQQHSIAIKLSSELADDASADDWLLVAKVGGLKNIAYSKLKTSSLKLLMDGSVKREDKISEFRKLVEPNSDLTCINWGLSQEGLTSLFQLDYQRDRFLFNSKQQSFFITLDSNISVPDKHYQFPYSVLTITYYDNVTQFASQISKLVESHLVFEMSPQFSVINFVLLKYFQLYLDPSQQGYPEWFNVIEDDVNIKKMPPQTSSASASIIRRPSNALDSTAPKSILLNNNTNNDSKKPSKNFRYWNEFENGSDAENDNDGGFYTQNVGPFDEELQFLSLTKVNKILKISNKIWNSLSRFNFFEKDNGSKIYLYSANDRHKSYGSFDSDDTENDDEEESEEDLNHLSRYPSPPFNKNQSIRSYNKKKTTTESNKVLLQKLHYDKVVTFLYFFIIFCSVLLNGISIGILFSLASNSLVTSNASLVMLVFIFICFFLGLILSITGICLISFRHNEPPLWHYMINYFVLFLNLFFICLGIFVISPALT